MRLENHLVVFVKAPRLGAVKRRLARDIGAFEAWRFYRRTLATVLRPLVADRRWRCWLAVTPDRFARAGRFWPDAPRVAQGPGDLGRRMGRVLRGLPAGPAVIVGSDIPDLRPAHVASAFAALGRCETVFGPASDGGYWLVGARRRPRTPDLFRDVRWSSEHALADTLANLPANSSAARLEVLDDIDDGAALARWRAGA